MVSTPQWILLSYFHSATTLKHWCPSFRRGPLIPVLTKTCQNQSYFWSPRLTSQSIFTCRVTLLSVCHQQPPSIKENWNRHVKTFTASSVIMTFRNASWTSFVLHSFIICLMWSATIDVHSDECKCTHQTTQVPQTYFWTHVLFVLQQTGPITVMVVKYDWNNLIPYSIFRGQTVRSWMFTHYHRANKQCQVCSTNRIKRQDFMSFTAAARHRPGNNGISFEAVHHGGNHPFPH